MTFTTPAALLLILLVPVVLWLGWPRFAYRIRRDVASLVLRVAMLLMLIFALAGLQVVQAADRLAVVFLIDVSDSIGQTAREQQVMFLRDAMAHMAPDDLAGIVVFGADARVERQVSAIRELGPLRSTPITSNTDLAEAIRLGLALFPPDTARRLVLLSDGQATVGDVEAAARLAAAAGVEISYVPFERERIPEVQLTDVRVPAVVNAGQEFDLGLTIDSQIQTAAVVTIFASGDIAHRERVQLEPGTNSYTLTLQAEGGGFRDFRVQVEPEAAEGFVQNNQLSTFSQVIGPPRVLIIAENSADSQYLARALEESGLVVDTAGPNDLPIGVAALAQYDSVLLANVPATRLSNARMRTLEAYVRDLGGGLVVVGGPNAYGPGGYFETPLEEMLPVQMRLADQQRVPQLTIAYVIDRSGSMAASGASDVPNIELAKEAIIRSIEFLQPTDRAGVVSFDTGGTWLAEVQPVLDRIGLQNLVGRIRAGGGTDIEAGMSAAAQVLIDDESPRKHIILLTDGGASPTGLVELTGELYEEHDITTSVIAIGSVQASQTFLDDMAEAGGGNFHAVDVVERIPTIFTLETVLATRSYIIEEPFVPTVASRSPMIAGMTSAPSLLGYVATSPKQTAQVVLLGPDEHNDPLLAAWQYGLGRSVAFTSDATARWGANWIGWEQFAQFWNQVVRWTITEGAQQNIETRVQMDGEQARVVVDARDSEGQFLNALNLRASLINPDLESRSVELLQVAPGRYEGTFQPDAEGAYFLTVTGQGAGNTPVQVSQRTGWVMSYSPEYRLGSTDANIDLLREVASLTEGRSLAGDPAAVFAHNLEFRSASTPLWPWLVLGAILLLPVDIAVRRLILTRSDIVRLRNFILRGTAEVSDAPAEHVAGLMNAKARAQEKAGRRTGGALSNRTSRGAAAPEKASRPAMPDSAVKPARPVREPEEDTNIAGRLLEKRRDRNR